MSDWRERLRARRAALEWKSLLRRMRPMSPAQGGHIRFDGGDCIDLCSNDYLGLSRNEEVVAGARRAAEKFGAGARASRLITGNYELLEELEGELASFKGTETATVFPSGYAANLGACSALIDSGDTVFADRLAHACLVDGVRLSGAKLRVFPHNDVKRLEELLEKNAARSGAGSGVAWILCEGVYSMDGDVAPLPELLRLAEKFGAAIIMDDAHGTGVLGERGRGTTEHFGIDPAAHAGRLVITATMSKALGAQGGVVLGAGEVRGALVNSARPFVYTTGLAPAAAGAALESLRIIARDGHRVRALQESSAMARSMLRGAGLNILRSESAIIPAVLGDAERALRASALLRERGVLALAVRPPTVPRGTSRLRLTVSAALEVAALEAACRQVGVVCNSLLARGVPNAKVEGEV